MGYVQFRQIFHILKKSGFFSLCVTYNKSITNYFIKIRVSQQTSAKCFPNWNTDVQTKDLIQRNTAKILKVCEFPLQRE